MSDYIKREDALRAFNGIYSTVDADDILQHLHKSIDVIKNIPSADVVECVQRNEDFDRVIEELLEIETENDIGYFTSSERSQFNAYVEDLLSMTIERAEDE